VGQVVEVLHLQAAGIGLRIRRRELGVIAHVGAVELVKKLGVQAKAGSGPDLLGKQQLAPARVSDDHVGHKALICAVPLGCTISATTWLPGCAASAGAR
jgi:hypothetical protein